MRKALILATASALLAFAGSASAQLRAQTRAQEGVQSRAGDSGWWPWAGGQFQSGAVRGNDRNRNDDRDDRGNGKQKKNGNGPPFCQNGQGHPTKGMAWCDQKGWTNGWERAGWNDVVLRSPRRSNSRYDQSTYDQSTLNDILGRTVTGRLASYANRLGVRSSLQARTVDLGRQGAVLQVRAGGVPLAEFTDFDRDGRVDLVLLAHAG